MSFYQNPLEEEFRGSLLLDDRQFVIDFPITGNVNHYDIMKAWNNEPYDLSASGILTINYAWDESFLNYSALAIDVTGAVPNATKASEIVTILNANATFASMFVALATYNANLAPPYTVYIQKKQSRAKQRMRVYITNTGAEVKLRFNLKAPVAELPTYFERHTIANRFAFPGSLAMLVHLDETNVNDQALITNAGFVPANMQKDWQLLKGRSDAFLFETRTYTATNQLSTVIRFGAGAITGNLAKKVEYVYASPTGSATQYFEIPYILTSGDLILPP